MYFCKQHDHLQKDAFKCPICEYKKTSQQNLLSCPFCGSEAQLGIDNLSLYAYVGCFNERCYIKPRYVATLYGNAKDIENNLVEIWNKRNVSIR